MKRISTAAALFLILTPMSVFSNDPVSHNNYGAILLENGEYAKALEQLKEAYRSFPYDETIKANLTKGYIVAGQRAMSKGELEEAEKQFSRAVELNPEDGEVRLFHGISLHAIKDYSYALTEYETAFGYLGDNKGYYFHAGRLKYDTGNLASACELWGKALELDPSDSKVSELLKKCRKEEAVESQMIKGGSGRFSISFDAGFSEDTASKVLDLLEEAYNKIGSSLGHYPSNSIPVLIYTKKSFKEVVSGPDWSGGVYDGKIRLPIGGVSEISEELKSLLFHEYTHVVVYELTHGNVPTWLNEGVAQYFSDFVQNTHTNSASKPFSLSKLSSPFTSLDRKDAYTAYSQSLGLVTFMIKSYGIHKIGDLLKEIGSGIEQSDAFRKVFSDFSLTEEEIYSAWLTEREKEMDK